MNYPISRMACTGLLLVGPPLGATEGSDASIGAFVTEQARELAAEPYSESDATLPTALQELDYAAYRAIRFRGEHALWQDQGLFRIEFFHPGFQYRQPVRINTVEDNRREPLTFTPDWFDYSDSPVTAEQAAPATGFAGFRVHYPLNTPTYADEFAVFQGASYFRLVGRGQRYGLSARGLAVDTATETGEEFPRFRAFWLERPAPDATTLTVHALLDGESVTGAYRFKIRPEANVAVSVRARLFAREDVTRLGLAPLTSMFMWGENSVDSRDDHRPQVHDSDGLLVHDADGEWIWRPLTNPRAVRVTEQRGETPRGFGLVQRERRFNRYLDPEARYDQRPSLWVTPRGGDWGHGAVQLVEIPSDSEANDNIVAFWVPDEPLRAGDERTVRYRLETFGAGRGPDELARVERTRSGWGATPGSNEQPPRSLRQFAVDFRGGALADLQADQPVTPELTARNGETRDVTVERLPDDAGWRVAFKLAPESTKPVDMRLHLQQRGHRLSETWNSVWDPQTTP